jgi:hypothetical protein
MKVALCFSGMPRYVAQTYNYWRKCLLDVYAPDVFVHTWCDQDQADSLKSQLFSQYAPVSCVVQPEIPQDVSIYKERIWPHRTTPAGVLSQWYSVKHALQQRKQHEVLRGFTYDVVIRARFDWFLEQVSLEQNDAWNIAHTPTLAGHKFTLRGQPLVGINDQFGYGASHTADVVSELFDHIPNLYQNEQVDFCSELFLKAHMHMNNIEIKHHVWNNGMVRWWGVNP